MGTRLRRECSASASASAFWSFFSLEGCSGSAAEAVIIAEVAGAGGETGEASGPEVARDVAIATVAQEEEEQTAIRMGWEQVGYGVQVGGGGMVEILKVLVLGAEVLKGTQVSRSLKSTRGAEDRTPSTQRCFPSPRLTLGRREDFGV